MTFDDLIKSLESIQEFSSDAITDAETGACAVNLYNSIKDINNKLYWLLEEIYDAAEEQ